MSLVKGIKKRRYRKEVDTWVTALLSNVQKGEPSFVAYLKSIRRDDYDQTIELGFSVGRSAEHTALDLALMFYLHFLESEVPDDHLDELRGYFEQNIPIKDAQNILFRIVLTVSMALGFDREIDGEDAALLFAGSIAREFFGDQALDDVKYVGYLIDQGHEMRKEFRDSRRIGP